ncbi:MAG TPA: class I SAM-dependent methyltransferase [Gemmatimonadaceae bacterium]|nr:class I SAM-dependent methyltransferase [Gemmatimonadaceae bacterium]
MKAAVALLAAATLAFEILLVRALAIEHFHHVAYMAIGVAMLGVGASGALVATAGGVGPAAAKRWFPTVTLLAALTLIVTPALVDRVPLDLTQLAWNAKQWPRLGAVYVLLALPFALSALAILLAITLEGDRPGATYGASFLGSGLGALLAIGVLWIAAPTRALAIPALVGALAAAVAAWRAEVPVKRLAPAAATLALAALVVVRPVWRITPSPYKGLPQVAAYPDARRVAERTSPLGWVVAVDAPAFRHAPGLSLAYAEEFPEQIALFVDGEIAGAVTRWDTSGAHRAMAILEWLPTALPYSLGDRGRVLVLGAGGGMDVWTAVAHGARRVVAVELNTALTRVSAELAPLPTRATTGVDIEWIAGDARAIVARTRERFDVITLAPGGGHGATAGGVHALNEDFLHTTEAYEQYLRLLTPEGVLAVTRWVTVPPRGSVRTILTAGAALRRARPMAMQNGIVVARSWGTTTVLVKPSGFTIAELERLRAWASSRQLDLDWYPGAVAPEARFHIPDDPTLVRAARAAVTHPDSAHRFSAAYTFAVDPVGDERPYPHRFLRASSIAAMLDPGSTSLLPFAEWGYIALVATVVQSAILAAVLVLLPAALRRRVTRGRGGASLSLVAYFSAIGFGYMAAEIALIQHLTLLLGHPVYAVATALASILICSGVGSAWSDKLASRHARIAAVLLATALAIFAVVLLGLVHLLQPAPLVARAAAGIALLAPVSLLMGMPFPVGLRAFARDEHARLAWGWGVNGFASVLAVPLAALIAVETGSRVLLLTSAAAYLVAAASARRESGAGRPAPIEAHSSDPGNARAGDGDVVGPRPRRGGGAYDFFRRTTRSPSFTTALTSVLLLSKQMREILAMLGRYPTHVADSGKCRVAGGASSGPRSPIVLSGVHRHSR